MSAQHASSPGAAARLLLLHGSASHSGMWKPVRALLAGCGETIAPDLIGYGNGAAWSEKEGVTLDDEVERLKPLLGPRERLHVVGYSYGGAVALALASTLPEKVESLTLIEPVVFPALKLADEDLHHATFRRWHREFTDRLDAGHVTAAMRNFIDLWSGESVWDGMPQLRQRQMEALARKIEWDWRASFAAGVDTSVLRQLARRTLLVRGDRSPGPMNALVGALHRLAGSAQLSVIPGANHMLPLTHAGELAELLYDRLGRRGAPGETSAQGAVHAVHTEAKYS